MTNEDVMKFFSEMGQLQRLKHSGWYLAGVKEPETVASHTFRAAIIGGVLAEMEGADSDKVTSMLVFHDIAEARIGDQNKVSARYFKKNEAEKTAFEDQIERIPDSLAKRLAEYRNEFEERNTKEGIVAKDADWLEQALTAKEFVEQGYLGAQNWIDNVEAALETESAKAILAEAKKTDFTNSWWKGLKKMTYKRLEEN